MTTKQKPKIDTQSYREQNHRIPPWKIINSQNKAAKEEERNNGTTKEPKKKKKKKMSLVSLYLSIII